MLIYAVSAMVGVWAAYDRLVALERLANLLMGLLLVLLLIWQARRDGVTMLYQLCQTCAILTGAVSIYFLLNHDWTAGRQYDFAPFQSVAVTLQQVRPQVVWSLDLHENLVANLLSILMPLSAGAAILARGQSRSWAVGGAVVSLGLGMLALVMTFSRGAWAGLTTSTLLALYLYWRTDSGRQSAWRPWVDLAVLGGGATLSLIIMLLLTPPFAQELQLLLPPGSTLVTHLQLWQDSLSLIRDYRYTGSGLGVSAMVYSTYYFLVHVPYLQHAHNLFLQVSVEQGLAGLIGLLGLVGVSVTALGRALQSTNITTRKMGTIGSASLAAMILHGLTDAELYAGSFALITFLPIGFALATIQLENDGKRGQKPTTSIGGIHCTWPVGRRVPIGNRFVDEVTSQVSKRQMIGWAIGATPIVFMVALLFAVPGSMAAVRANWGAVLQTRAELSTYTWPEWPVQDMVRRMHRVELAPAISEYRAALALDASNVTANRRLGQLALSLGQYNVARRRLEIAYSLSPHDQTTIQLLGEVYAVQGNVEDSTNLWAFTSSDVHERLYMRKWWYEFLDASQEAESLNKAIVQIEQR